MKYVVHYFFLVFLRLFPYKFLTVWQFGFTIHNDTLTYLGSFYFAGRLLLRSWWRAMLNNREANKTLLRLHFTKMWRETYSAYKYIYMDLRLTSDRGPWINQSESAKSFIFKIHHDSCWCCYLILWGVIKRVIFCLGWTIISYKNYCKFSFKWFEALDKIPELGMYSLRLIMLSIPLPSILKWNIWEMCDSLNRLV